MGAWQQPLHSFGHDVISQGSRRPSQTSDGSWCITRGQQNNVESPIAKHRASWLSVVLEMSEMFCVYMESGGFLGFIQSVLPTATIASQSIN